MNLDWLVATVVWRAVWKSAPTVSGVPFVTRTGTAMMLRLSAVSLALVQEVRL